MGNLQNKKNINGLCKINRGAHILEGMFVDNELNGYGTILMYRRGGFENHYVKKVGMFENGLLHGQGLFVQLGNTRLEGEFEFDRLNGIGTKTYDSGAVTTGTFKSGRLNGLCKEVLSTGTIIEGIYEMGVLIKGTITYEDGIIAIGEFGKMKKLSQIPLLHGKGKLIKPDGEVREGYFKNGIMEGFCTIHRDGKLVNRGEFENDKNVLGLRYYYDTNGVVLTFDHQGNPVEDETEKTRNSQLISTLAEMIDT
jgi:hypothetical protein